MASDTESKVGCVVFLIVCGLIMLCVTWGVVGGMTFSTGQRDGYVQKFSNRGILIKSWEGELALSAFRIKKDGNNSSIVNAWEFSVEDRSVADQLLKLRGDELVRLHYRQVWPNNPFAFATGYRVTRVEKLP